MPKRCERLAFEAGGMALSIQDFLKNYLDLAKGISPEPCHAPCEGAEENTK